ncbi:hypothetical protein BDN72DRAFT_66969 [Pluteus cervinus]|uniref:Uncharacterized protein n=1 Tax=Pluteus cervinus TaxID=181527 RepID=A0ACD3AQK5_9AGAR|nr:hypothetical protein BDN72DRAFT_66969 [Pluteus cervinus]
MQLLCADRRIDISHKTKTKTTSLYRIPSSDESNESLYREKQFLQKLVRPPMNKARAATSILNGWLLFSQWESTNHIQYLDLSIQALSAGHAYPRDYSQPPHSHIIFCDILFNRCTLPNGDSFVSNAFDALTKLDTIPDLDDEILKPFVEVVLQVLRKHHDPNYATTVFRVLAPSICALYQSRKTVPEFLVQATLFAFELAPKAEETFMILDSTLQFISPVLPVSSNGKLWLSGAFSRLTLYEDERSPSCDVVMITA